MEARLADLYRGSTVTLATDGPASDRCSCRGLDGGRGGRGALAGDLFTPGVIPVAVMLSRCTC
jgi:hypothetical protein